MDKHLCFCLMSVTTYWLQFIAAILMFMSVSHLGFLKVVGNAWRWKWKKIVKKNLFLLFLGTLLAAVSSINWRFCHVTGCEPTNHKGCHIQSTASQFYLPWQKFKLLLVFVNHRIYDYIYLIYVYNIIKKYFWVNHVCCKLSQKFGKEAINFCL